MITVYPDKNVFDSPAQTIVNPVNCVGVMGKGLALAVKNRYPKVFEKYVTSCKTGKLRIGTLQLVKTDDRWILNFPTKNHWRGDSKLEYIEAGLKKFVKTYRRRGIASAAFPALGCGHGGLQWNVVEPLMRRYLGCLDKIEIFFCLGGANSSTEKGQVSHKSHRAESSQRGLWD
jgi:O-acetyl-ADP-ribose deacetylase (regulator of RNase III)